METNENIDANARRGGVVGKNTKTRPNTPKISAADVAANAGGGSAVIVARKALHEPRIPPAEFRPYTPKWVNRICGCHFAIFSRLFNHILAIIRKSSKWPQIAIPPIRTEQWRCIDSNVWQLPPKTSADIGMRKYDGKSAAMSLAAIAFGQVYPVAEWHPSDVNKILDIGRYLHRTSCLRNKSETRSIRPSDIISGFYIDFTKLTTLVSTDKMRGEFGHLLTTTSHLTPNAVSGAADLAHMVRSCLGSDNAGCVIGYDKHRYAAIWHSSDNFYVFYSHDHDQQRQQSSSNHRVRESCCLRIASADAFLRFMPRLLRPQKMRYTLTAVKILNVQEVSKYPEENPQTCVQRQWSDQSMAAVQHPVNFDDTTDDTAVAAAMRADRGGGDDDVLQRPLAMNADFMEQFDVKPYLMDFQQAYVPLQSGVEILRGFNYAEQNFRIPCMNVAAIAMLRLSRSFTWTWDTLEEVLTLGNRIYEDNRTHVDGPEILATDVTQLIRMGRVNYTVDAEQAVFGELQSSNGNVPDLVRALEVFFGVYEAGVLQGPQSVAVWHELGHFYMFDAKERDRFGRKWTASMSGEHAADADGNVETVGCCCVTRFLNIASLVQLYCETVPLKHRHDAFRVTRVEINDYRDRSDDWFNWHGIGMNRWIVRGKFYQGNSRFEEEGRNMQATCIGAVAVLFSETVKMQTWNGDVVDEILLAGDALHRQSVDQLKQREKFVSQMLLPSEISRYFVLKDQNVQFTIEECVVNGSLQASNTTTGPNKTVSITLAVDQQLDLVGGFTKFFLNSTSGLLTACETTISFWTKDGFYYVFDSHARDENGRNPNTCRSNLKKGNLGTSCVQRFAVFTDFVQAVLGNFELKSTPAVRTD